MVATLSDNPLKRATVATCDVTEPMPAEVALVMSALDVGARSGERRAVRRWRYRVIASLRLFSDQAATPPWLLYTRDVNTRSLGFVTSHRLPLGYGGVLELPGPLGEPMRVHCTLLRCREAAPGWYEGSVYFNREQGVFDLDGGSQI
jgi:hypothetical protein